MHAFSVVTLGIFIAGYSTARWDLVTRLYELAIFAWDHGVVVRPVNTLPAPRIRSHSANGTDKSRQRLCNTIHLFLPFHSPY